MQKTILFCGFVILNLFLIGNVHSEEFVKTTESKDIISDSDLEADDKIVREKAKNLSINFSSAESFPEVSKPFRIINNELYWSRPPRIIFNKNDLEGQDRSILVSVIANEQGKIAEAKILRSSGLSKLDTKALNAAKAAKFKPFYVGGKYHTINVVLPFQFHYE